jgi:hypothetical protein
MLHHLTRHAFEPADRVRLIHLYDLWRYQTRFRDEIDWDLLATSRPHVMVALRLVDQVFPRDGRAADDACTAPAGAGFGMVPLSQIAAAELGPIAKLRKLLDPPAWWLRGFYGVPPERSLWVCRFVQHPATVARWLGRRLVGRARPHVT